MSSFSFSLSLSLSFSPVKNQPNRRIVCVYCSTCTLFSPIKHTLSFKQKWLSDRIFFIFFFWTNEFLLFTLYCQFLFFCCFKNDFLLTIRVSGFVDFFAFNFWLWPVWSCKWTVSVVLGFKNFWLVISVVWFFCSNLICDFLVIICDLNVFCDKQQF